MTFDAVVEVGKEKLEEYEPRLKIQGQRPYSQSANELQQRYECSLPAVGKEDIKLMVSSVLEGLVNLKDGFVMSEPPNGLLSPSVGRASVLRGVATHNLLNLLFTNEYDPRTDKGILTVWTCPHF